MQFIIYDSFYSFDLYLFFSLSCKCRIFRIHHFCCHKLPTFHARILGVTIEGNLILETYRDHFSRKHWACKSLGDYVSNFRARSLQTGFFHQNHQFMRSWLVIWTSKMFLLCGFFTICQKSTNSWVLCAVKSL